MSEVIFSKIKINNPEQRMANVDLIAIKSAISEFLDSKDVANVDFNDCSIHIASEPTKDINLQDFITSDGTTLYLSSLNVNKGLCQFQTITKESKSKHDIDFHEKLADHMPIYLFENRLQEIRLISDLAEFENFYELIDSIPDIIEHVAIYELDLPNTPEQKSSPKSKMKR